MSNAQITFQNIDSFKNHITDFQRGAIFISYTNMHEYPGMARALSIIFDANKNTLDLSIEWMSLGLDLYGDTLQECYIYRFENTEKLIAYLKTRFKIQMSDIPIKFQFDQNNFPNPIKDENKKQLFEEAWERFQTDFKNNIFLDKTQELIFNSIEI